MCQENTVFRALRFLVINLALIAALPAMAAEKVHVSVDASKPGAQISRNLSGQFAENLGQGNYDGIWVGTDSSIPNTRGIRNDVVAALRDLKVPNVRWPGGCFADEYHWRNGVGPRDKRPATMNSAWGGVGDTNAFGTDEFMDFVQQIGSQAYVSINVGSGTVQEASDWLGYMTAPETTGLGRERSANGHPQPYKVGFLGIGNESWDCGGNMTPDYYVQQLKIYSHFAHNLNAAQRGQDSMVRVAVGPGTMDTDWTDALMKAQQHHSWDWDIEAMSLHWYTNPNWPPSGKSEHFGLDEYSKYLKLTLQMDDLLKKQEAVMDKYDPQKKVAISVDEWGAWYAPLSGSNPAFLIQQNTMRDAILAALNLNIFARHADRVRMANIAQMVNVLQAMILTDKEKMVLTPTYYVLRMYVPFQDAKFVPVSFNAGTYAQGDVTLPRVDAIAAKDVSGRVVLELTNLDPHNALEIDADIAGVNAKSASGETLTAAAVDSMNTFDAPKTVTPKALAVSVSQGKLSVTLAPMSVSVITIQAAQ